MEELEQGEVQLSDGCLDTQVKNGAIDEPLSGALLADTPKGIYKAFQNIMYNQKLIDEYSCTLVWPFTALSNYTGNQIPLTVQQEGLQRYVKSGLFTPWVGGKMTDGATIALDVYNSYFGTKIQINVVPLNADTIRTALESGSPINTGIYYWPSYFSNEQDDGVIENTAGTTGKNGHCITIVKLNTMDDILIKFAENYNGILKYQIIMTNFVEMRSLFFNTGIYYSWK